MHAGTDRVRLDLPALRQLHAVSKYQVDPGQGNQVARIKQSLVDPLAIDKGAACGMQVEQHKIFVDHAYLEMVARDARVIDHNGIVMAAANAGHRLVKRYGFYAFKDQKDIFRDRVIRP